MKINFKKVFSFGIMLCLGFALFSCGENTDAKKLASAREEALENVETYKQTYTLNEYATEEEKELISLYNVAVANIKVASTPDETVDILNNFQAEIDKLVTNEGKIQDYCDSVADAQYKDFEEYVNSIPGDSEAITCIKDIILNSLKADLSKARLYYDGKYTESSSENIFRYGLNTYITDCINNAYDMLMLFGFGGPSYAILSSNEIFKKSFVISANEAAEHFDYIDIQSYEDVAELKKLVDDSIEKIDSADLYEDQDFIVNDFYGTINEINDGIDGLYSFTFEGFAVNGSDYEMYDLEEYFYEKLEVILEKVMSGEVKIADAASSLEAEVAKDLTPIKDFYNNSILPRYNEAMDKTNALVAKIKASELDNEYKNELVYNLLTTFNGNVALIFSRTSYYYLIDPLEVDNLFDNYDSEIKYIESEFVQQLNDPNKLSELDEVVLMCITEMNAQYQDIQSDYSPEMRVALRALYDEIIEKAKSADCISKVELYMNQLETKIIERNILTLNAEETFKYCGEAYTYYMGFLEKYINEVDFYNYTAEFATQAKLLYAQIKENADFEMMENRLVDSKAFIYQSLLDNSSINSDDDDSSLSRNEIFAYYERMAENAINNFSYTIGEAIVVDMDYHLDRVGAYSSLFVNPNVTNLTAMNKLLSEVNINVEEENYDNIAGAIAALNNYCTVVYANAVKDLDAYKKTKIETLVPFTEAQLATFGPKSIAQINAIKEEAIAEINSIVLTDSVYSLSLLEAKASIDSIFAEYDTEFNDADVLIADELLADAKEAGIKKLDEYGYRIYEKLLEYNGADQKTILDNYEIAKASIQSLASYVAEGDTATATVINGYCEAFFNSVKDIKTIAQLAAEGGE